jgi:hypothetical protein
MCKENDSGNHTSNQNLKANASGLIDEELEFTPDITNKSNIATAAKHIYELLSWDKKHTAAFKVFQARCSSGAKGWHCVRQVCHGFQKAFDDKEGCWDCRVRHACDTWKQVYIKEGQLCLRCTEIPITIPMRPRD